MNLPEKPSQPEPTQGLFVSDEEVRAAATRRARETHRERDQQAAEAEQEQIEAIFLRLQQAADARREREVEEEAARRDAQRRNTTIENERQAMAQQRYREANAASERDQQAIAGDRPLAISDAVHSTVQTHDEHAAAAAAAADPTGEEFRAEMQRRAEVTARARRAREEAEREAAATRRDHQAAAALLAQQAREAQREHEREDAGTPRAAPAIDPERVRQLSALINRPGRTRRTHSGPQVAAEASRPEPVNAPALPESSPKIVDSEAPDPGEDRRETTLGRVQRIVHALFARMRRRREDVALVRASEDAPEVDEQAA